MSLSGLSLGGGGSWEDLVVIGGSVAYRLAASQYVIACSIAATGVHYIVVA